MSVPFQAGDAVRWSAATLREGSEETVFAGVSIDSRTLDSGQLFVAIRGPRHDGHRFLDQAIARGAAGLMVQRGEAAATSERDGLAILEVDEGVAALGALAKGHRKDFNGPLVAITGISSIPISRFDTSDPLWRTARRPVCPVTFSGRDAGVMIVSGPGQKRRASK